MKRTSILTLLLLSALAALGQQMADLERAVVATEKESGMRHGILSVSVYNISKEKELYSHNAQVSQTPASVNKLFTTGVGFALLGSDFRFTTRLCLRGEVDREGVLHGNVYIIGGGDPLLGSYRYRQTAPDSLFDGWYRALRKKGVKRIDGRVCYITNIFDDQPLHDSWQWGDIGNYYAAGVSGLNFHENMYFVHFAPGSKLGYPASSVRTVPKNIGINGKSEVTTGPEGSGDNVVIYGSPTNGDRLYRGTVPLGKSDFRVRGAMPSPAQRCADLFASYLRTHGVSVPTTAMQVYSQPDSLRPVLDYRSSDYYTIAQYTNLTSNNVYAESIFKYLGYSKYGKGSFHNGSKAVMNYFREKRLDYGGVRIEDGSGLSRLNRTTTDFLCRYLAMLQGEAFFDDFLRSLAVVGESGTAKNLLPNLPNGVKVHVKTGTIDGVKSYAGYVDAANGDRLAFAIISNGHDASSAAVAEKLNKILMKIATLY
ncbi:MAG: D-alanyl-D-alanine carboxypeptidase/D-alanyl-D-alanine-endopeptidase [Bacteroidales bacterium]|nr:D-alanyl-D-alanine carboxypeptidase/D-alanyl-D-alanine-endopeptidase [Bacteroidales bacterium]